MYITNKPEVAKIAEDAGVNRIFVDMEYIGKEKRQGGMDTVKSRHTFEDIRKIAEVLKKAELLVRVNPIHEKTEEYVSSKKEIDEAIACGAQILMLPYFKTVNEVERFLEYVGGRAKTMLLVETPEAVESIDDILNLDGIDEVFIGLNDLSLGYEKKFMFELLTDGTVEKLCNKFKQENIPYGFGGIASLGKGTLPAEKIMVEHYRLGSTSVILSRSFCNVNKITDLEEIKDIFEDGLKRLREYETKVEAHVKFFKDNIEEIKQCVEEVIGDNL